MTSLNYMLLTFFHVFVTHIIIGNTPFILDYCPIEKYITFYYNLIKKGIKELKRVKKG